MRSAIKAGCHISIRSGYFAAAKTAKAIEADAFQYFPKNPRSLSIKTFDAKDAENCRRFCRENDIVSIAHTSYPVNIAAEDPALRKAMLQSLINDFDIAEHCGSLGVVVHFGNFKGKDPLQGYKNSIQLLNELLQSREMACKVLVENQAGSGTMMGTMLEELVQIRELCILPEHIGFCLDTCHLFASGVWNGENWPDLERLGRDIGYFSHLCAVHLNDSRYESGSRKDRHANIGKGKIGLAPFKAFLHSSVIKGMPCLLETPSDTSGSHMEELRTIRLLAAGGDASD